MKRLLGTLLVCLMAQGAFADTKPGRIVTEGTGSVEAVPDAAQISVGVVRDAPEAAEALEAASEAMRQTIARFTDMGVAERDMQTGRLSVGPVWSNRGPGDEDAPRITGFVARNSLTVNVRDLSALGTILDAAVGEGANSFDGLRFLLSDPKPLEAQARKAAVTDAMARAQDLAAAAGVALGDILLIDATAGQVARPMAEMATARMASDMPVAAGELTVSVEVTMTFAIAP